VLLASFEPRRDRTSTDRRFVQKPTRHASSRQFESQPAQARGRYEPTLNARPHPPSGSYVDCGLAPGARQRMTAPASDPAEERAVFGGNWPWDV
jgi:hypothetical protein